MAIKSKGIGDRRVTQTGSKIGKRSIQTGRILFLGQPRGVETGFFNEFWGKGSPEIHLPVFHVINRYRFRECFHFVHPQIGAIFWLPAKLRVYFRFMSGRPIITQRTDGYGVTP